MNNQLLEVKNLTVKLDGDTIIKDLSFSVAEGNVLTVLGPNGAGKSVLLRTLLGLLPYQGDIHWSHKPLISYLPQGLNQLSVKGLPLTVQDFFMLKAISPTLEKITEFLHLVGLDKEILNKKAGDLSGGQFQRMLVAWVLISQPEVVFLDEPMTGIDIGGGETIYSLLQHIKKDHQKMTIFMVTHDLNIVSGFSTNVLCLSRKGFSCFGEPKEINIKTLEDIFGKGVKLYEHH